MANNVAYYLQCEIKGNINGAMKKIEKKYDSSQSFHSQACRS
jgi:hypothetical protein